MATEPRDDTPDHHGCGVPEQFTQLSAAVTARLPFGMSRVVPPTFVGFAAINGSTFCADLLILTALHSHWQVPYAVAVGVGYAVAFALSFALNRVLNFRSHDPIGRQILVYIGVVAVNFAILIGVSPGLEAIGVQYQVARVAAGGCEDLFMYCAMRWIVFRGFDGAGAGRLSRGGAISTRSRTPSAAERSSRRPCPRSPGPPTIDT